MESTHTESGLTNLGSERDNGWLQNVMYLAGILVLLGALCGTIYLIFHIDLASGVAEVERQLRNDDPVVQGLAAQELLHILKRTTPSERVRKGIDDQRLGQKVHVALKRNAEGNDSAAGYLMLCAAHLGVREAIPDMVAAVKQQSGEARVELRTQALLSLGILKDEESLPYMVDALKNENPAVRKSACLAIASVGSKASAIYILPLLDDSQLDVKWSASLALAKLGSSAGEQNLHAMLDRDFLGRQNWSEQTRESLMVDAMQSVAVLKIKGFEDDLQRIASADPNLRVRSAAMTALNALKE